MLKERITLDRRRLEDAHMIYAVLNVMAWYPESFGPETRKLKPTNFNEVLSHITPIFHECFSEKYTGTHILAYLHRYIVMKFKPLRMCPVLDCIKVCAQIYKKGPFFHTHYFEGHFPNLYLLLSLTSLLILIQFP